MNREASFLCNADSSSAGGDRSGERASRVRRHLIIDIPVDAELAPDAAFALDLRIASVEVILEARQRERTPLHPS